MAVIKRKKVLFNAIKGKIKPEPFKHTSLTKPGTLQSITAAALVLPGLISQPVHADDEDEVDFQYSHYQEGKRNLFGNVSKYSPIEVDSLHGSAKVKLTDRVKFAFNYLQDTWGGATPIATAPEAFGGNGRYGIGQFENEASIKSGASPYIFNSKVLLDQHLQPVPQLAIKNNEYSINNQLVHILSQASPETRKQGDFKLSYDWDDVSVSAGGGISVENDYESRFGNLGGRMDFNNKMTSVNLGLSYTNSDTNAIIDHDALGYFYDLPNAYDLDDPNKFYNSSHPSSKLIYGSVANAPAVIVGNRQDWGVQLGLTQILNKNAVLTSGLGYIRSTGYMDNPYKGVGIVFLDSNPNICPESSLGLQCGVFNVLAENRPTERNQWTGDLGLVQFIEPLNAAVHFNYRIFSDDWGITSHTFESDWVQPLGAGWTVTPRIRYYSQDQADFYVPYLIANQPNFHNAVDANGREIFYDGNTGDFKREYFTNPDTGEWFDVNGNNVTDAVNNGLISPANKTVSADRNKLPSHFSSDQRLSGYGALSGGITLSKQFAKGVALDLGFEYYTHQGSFKIGGGGEGNYADFDFWVANAALKVNLAALAFNGEVGGHSSHSHHGHNAQAPAGVMFDHMLPRAGDMMVGYRYMYGSQGGKMLNGTRTVDDAEIIAQGCAPDQFCFLSPDNMSMHMHMVELMYAPTDWMTLMLMPQFVDMEMDMRQPVGDKVYPTQPNGIGGHIAHHDFNSHETGGIGDLGMYAMFKLFDNDVHHLHATAGLSAPTGDVDIHLRRNHQIDGGFIHYGMQLGSGTWDFKPSLTYIGHIDSWSWGAQASGTVRMEDHNKSGYALGDIFQATAWGGYGITRWLTASVRGVYTIQGRINGQFYGSDGQFTDPIALDENGQPKLSSILKFGPMDYPNNYGGRFWDVGFGLSADVPSGSLEGNRFSVEWLQPVYTDVNGYQLDRDGALSATWSMVF